MPIVAELFEYVVGIDTHARTHTYCVLACATGAVVDTATFPTSKAGQTRAVSWITRRTGGSVLAAVEGTSSYGATITKTILEAGIDVTEVRPAGRKAPAHHGKSDAIDAETAARSILGRDHNTLARPRSTGRRTALRVLLASRSLIDQQRTANRNALTALLRGADLGIDARRPITDAQVRTIAAWRIGRDTSQADALAFVRREARRLAIAILEQTELLKQNHRELHELANELAPGLQNLPGVGPVTAAITVCAYSHHGRVRSEAAFAALGGIAPIPASSGNTSRHRLTRSGDRQLNRAFDVIVRTRMSYDPTTREYVARRRAEGRTTREIRRCLKRYVCRAIFRELQTIMA
ncbi:IS110 family transposase [Streptomyces sp. PSKA54]|uniref:IS110 family transposase n=1 Tax=Streptomyces himalayensis subsp. aureolus TaxID=2758039 RepID=A0A7W2DA57_9ACTN|nr:IS110 family transposase [Streptomyces himalayensis]MBA4867355.1 IS110 family transposase [Streptomyces himalayensis subsp. aureolus]